MALGFETAATDSFRLRALRSGASRRAGADDLLPLIWSSLKRGSLVVHDNGIDAERAWLVLERPECVQSLRRAGLGDRTLDSVLLGRPQKLVAIEQGVSFSTLAVALKNSIARMNVGGCPSRVPLALPLLAHAVARRGALRASVAGHFPTRAGDRCLVVLERLEAVLRGILSPSEFAVAHRLLEGRGYTEIAEERGASARTIANQICSIGKKLGARGRFDVLRVTVGRHSSMRTRLAPSEATPAPAGDASALLG
ncbi:MAG TPA: LuxR C-terminal-related transcriptional regulator [Polyangiaceae bacterium]